MEWNGSCIAWCVFFWRLFHSLFLSFCYLYRYEHICLHTLAYRNLLSRFRCFGTLVCCNRISILFSEYSDLVLFVYLNAGAKSRFTRSDKHCRCKNHSNSFQFQMEYVIELSHRAFSFVYFGIVHFRELFLQLNTSSKWNHIHEHTRFRFLFIFIWKERQTKHSFIQLMDDKCFCCSRHFSTHFWGLLMEQWIKWTFWFIWNSTRNVFIFPLNQYMCWVYSSQRRVWFDESDITQTLIRSIVRSRSLLPTSCPISSPYLEKQCMCAEH